MVFNLSSIDQTMPYLITLCQVAISSLVLTHVKLELTHVKLNSSHVELNSIYADRFYPCEATFNTHRFKVCLHITDFSPFNAAPFKGPFYY